MNCLAHALNAWHTDGGYIVLRKSAARATPHVLHIGDEGLQHYSTTAPAHRWGTLSTRSSASTA